MSFGASTSKSQSNSGNQAYDYIKGAFSPAVAQGGQANNFIAQLLGLGGGEEAGSAFKQFRDSTGYGFQMDAGNDAITSSAASKGLLNSGATLKARQKFGSGLGANYFQQFLQNLQGVGSNALAAGGLIGNAGQVSSSSGNSKSLNFSF